MDLTIGKDIMGNETVFIEESHLIWNDKTQSTEVDFILCIIDDDRKFINLSPKFFRLIDKKGNQLNKTGWIKHDKIIKWD